jgi:valyl-tRNA synthetase
MTLPKRYNPQTREPELRDWWQANGIYHFDPDRDAPIYAIDTPPPTVSGHLHLGHTYSYSHTDFMARFWRMNGRNIYYPMGYDDNGLPTERLVEKREGITVQQIGRQAFIERCLAISAEAEEEYEALWQRLGLSVDWRHTYRTVDERSRGIAQWSFLDLYRQGLAYRQQAPTIWCPECQTAIAQAEVDDLSRESEYVTLAFTLADGSTLPIATTRPELLPACVAIFVHPEDGRFHHLLDQQATVPLFNQSVPILADPAADPEKGTGAVMCCTFGDTADVTWWHSHKLPLIEAIGRDGHMLPAAGPFARLPIATARQQIKQALEEAGLLLGRQATMQTIGIHERCDTPVEYIVTNQWFIRALDFKEPLLAAGEQIEWHPAHMQARYRQWVENLGWDWCISRQRTFGVTFPIWYCDQCGQIILAGEADLPLDPTEQQPTQPCPTCGSTNFTPETDVMDTWATSSMSPQIAGRPIPYSLRPQAHEIIRTWAFYTILKSLHHYGQIPWTTIALSGWGLAPEGASKISKSRGGGPMAPMAMIEQYSADALRYWAASTGFGKDSRINEEKIQAGVKLVNKLWNVARFSGRFLDKTVAQRRPSLSLADRWLLSHLQRLIQRTTDLFRQYDYATAKSEIEQFFWRDLADNYLEMAKQRLYDGPDPGAQYTLYHTLLTILNLFAPFLPYVTEAIYQGLFVEELKSGDGTPPISQSPNLQKRSDRSDRSDPLSIHRSQWPVADESLLDEMAESTGSLLIEIATAVRRYKSEHNLSLGTELAALHLQTADPQLTQALNQGLTDLSSVTRARQISFVDDLPEDRSLRLASAPVWLNILTDR